MRKLCLWVSLMIFGWSSGASALPVNNPIIAGLVAAYEFGGNADDVSGNGNDGVVNGATPTTDRFGNANSAYSFDGVGDYIDLGAQNFGESVSVSLWANFDRVWNKPQALISKYDGDTGPGDLSIDRTFSLSIADQSEGRFNQFEWQFSENGVLGSSGTSTSSAVADHWYHVVGTYDSGEAKIFIDGVEENSWDSGFNSLHTSDVKLLLGIFTNDFPVVGDLPLEGRLDDVYIYDRALSPTEVQTLYSAVPEPSTALLLGLGLAGIAIRKRR